MAGGGSRREAALATLKESLVRQYGAASRDVVEAEVGLRLAGRSRLDPEDLDAIERAVLEAKRLRRRDPAGATGLASSAPNLRALRGGGAAAASAAAAPSPPEGPAGPALSRTPSGPSARRPRPAAAYDGARAQVAATAAPSMAGSTAFAGLPKSQIKPPWGIGSTLHEDTGEGNRPFVGKHFVPLPPKSKPVDHFDVIAMYDAVKAQEEKEDFKKNAPAKRIRVKANLDSQMLELTGLRREEQLRLERQREQVRATVERDNELTRRENEVELAKRTRMMEANDVMSAALSQKELQARERRQREQQHMLGWLEAEKQRAEDEKRTLAAEHARASHTMRSQMLAALEEEQAKRKAERAMDVEMVKGAVAQADDRAERNRDAVRQRFAVIDRNCATLGKQIEERDAKMEKDLQESMKRAIEKFDRQANEKDQKEKSERERKTKEMVETLHEQMKEKSERWLVDEEANRIQVGIWRKQLAEFEAAQEKKKVWLKDARHDVDQKLVEQMRENAKRHPAEKGEPHLGEALKIRDAAFNRPLYERMFKEGFREELTGELSKAQFSKLDPHPSVGRSQQHLDASEVKERLDKVKALTRNKTTKL